MHKTTLHSPNPDFMYWVPVYKSADSVDRPFLYRGLDRRKVGLFSFELPHRPVPEIQGITVVNEAEVIVAALNTANAKISDRELDILHNPGDYPNSEYKGLADYQWWRISELGGAALEQELKNFNLIYPHSV